jgi:hypothetical protein
MKKTLYQILGVDPKASAQEIETAYAMRIEELKMATMHDPNKLVVLQQSKAILADPVQRAAYDMSLSIRDAPASHEAEDEPDPSFLHKWGKWIAAGVVLIGLFVLWPKRVASPPPPKQIASPTTESVLQPVQPASEPAAVPADPKNAAIPAVSVQPPAESPANAVSGVWSCSDVISGRTSKYNFQQDGILRIASSDGQVSEFKYELAGKVLTLSAPQKVSALAVEELVAGKMILNTGDEGRRLVCNR